MTMLEAKSGSVRETRLSSPLHVPHHHLLLSVHMGHCGKADTVHMPSLWDIWLIRCHTPNRRERNFLTWRSPHLMSGMVWGQRSRNLFFFTSSHICLTTTSCSFKHSFFNLINQTNWKGKTPLHTVLSGCWTKCANLKRPYYIISGSTEIVLDDLQFSKLLMFSFSTKSV